MKSKYGSLCAIVGRSALALLFAATALAQTEKVIYTFTGGSDGGSPFCTLVTDGKGNLYGTAQEGGSTLAGVVFELSPSNNGGWTEQVLYNFTGFSGNGDGYSPMGGLVFDAKGNLYGMTSGGGTAYQGTIFELSSSNGTWAEQVLYNFRENDGIPQGSSLLIDASGNLYGVTPSGGNYSAGVVFELANQNGTWTWKTLHNFTGGNDGYFPYMSSLSMDSAGDIYGATTGGGLHDYGTIFKLSRGSNGAWTEQVVYSFTGVGGISNPIGSLTFDARGDIYATAFEALEFSLGSNGVYTQKALHFFSGGSDGTTPESGLIFDAKGNLYGTTFAGGTHRGTVYELSPSSNGTWTEKVLHRFSGTGGDGLYPSIFSLTVDAQGNVYGTTTQGGSSNFGIVYEVIP